MTHNLTTDEVWTELEKNLFAVIGMVTASNESRTVGVVYVVHDRKLYTSTGRDTWKARHIARNPHVSVTVPIAKRIPFLPWIKIPAATITFCGRATLLSPGEVPPGILQRVLRGAAVDPEMMAELCLIEVTPEKDFITYGVGIPLLQMRFPEKACGRVSVGKREPWGDGDSLEEAGADESVA